VTVKLSGLEVPPPGAGLVTVTDSVPVEAMLEAAMAAVNCVEAMNVVAGAAPPKLTVEAVTKLLPLIVSVKAAPPAAALFGEIPVIVGVGIGGGLLTGWPVPPPHPHTPITAATRTAIALGRNLTFGSNPVCPIACGHCMISSSARFLSRTWSSPPKLAQRGLSCNGRGLVRGASSSLFLVGFDYLAR
jgi:hypothetical protein